MDRNINIGDKVRFLNDIGGGTVTGFQRGGIVLVEDEDGFEIPVREQEVVLVSAAEKKLTRQSEPVREEEEDDQQPAYRVKSILAGKAAPRQTDYHSSVIERPSGPSFVEAPQTVPDNQPETVEERVARLERLVKKLQLRIEQLEGAKSLREKLEATGMKVTETSKKPRPSGGHDKKDDILEIDLHAEELLETTAGMSPSDIKDYQIEVFRRTLNEHLKDKGRRIVFIHGNGEGVLRRAILDELRRNYKQCQWQDASFQQYGFGATMVTV